MTSKAEIRKIEKETGERRNDLRREYNRQLLSAGDMARSTRDPMSHADYRWKQYKRKQRSRKLRKLHEQEGSRNLVVKTRLQTLHQSGSRNVLQNEDED